MNQTSKPITILSAAVFIEIPLVVASQTVLAVLACAVLADLALRNGQVTLSGALASEADVNADEATRPADKRGGTPPLEKTDPRRRQASRAGSNTFGVQQIRPVSADATGVAGDSPLTEVASAIKTATILAGQHTTLNTAAPA